MPATSSAYSPTWALNRFPRKTPPKDVRNVTLPIIMSATNTEMFRNPNPNPTTRESMLVAIAVSKSAEIVKAFEPFPLSLSELVNFLHSSPPSLQELLPLAHFQELGYF